MQGISYKQPRFIQQPCYAFRNVGVSVAFALARDKHQIVSRLDVRHQISNRRLKLTTDFISTHGVSELFTDGKPRLRNFVVAFAIQQYKVFVGNALGVFVHIVVLIIFFKSVLRLQGNYLLMRKENDDPCFFFLQEFYVRRLSSFLHGSRALCFFVFFWVGKFFSF